MCSLSFREKCVLPYSLYTYWVSDPGLHSPNPDPTSKNTGPNFQVKSDPEHTGSDPEEKTGPIGAKSSQIEKTVNCGSINESPV